MSFLGLGNLFSSKNTERAIERGRQAIEGGYRSGEGRAFGEFDTGLAGAKGQYDKALGLYSDYMKSGSGASSAYSDALGINGPEGNARAVAAFRAGPGYQFAVDEANNAVMRNAAQLGMLGSGNTMDAIRARTQGFADQEFQRYLDNLFRQSGQGLTATDKSAGIITGYGDKVYDTGMTKGAMAYGTETGIGQATANAEAQKAQAQQAAAKARWEAILGVGKLAASVATGIPMPSFGGGTTTPGTAANGGWTTTTTPSTGWW
jgi:hypothetical protein